MFLSEVLLVPRVFQGQVLAPSIRGSATEMCCALTLTSQMPAYEESALNTTGFAKI